MTKLNTADFIAQSILTHGNRYDYSRVIYCHGEKPVEIICAIHGSFWQKPNNHKRGCGCPICGEETRQKSKITSTQHFIDKSHERHGNTYDYSKSICLGASKKVKIICKIHGPFWQLAFAHMDGKGCWNCGVIKSAESRHHTSQTYIESVKIVHGDTYDYSNLIFLGDGYDVEIICRIHGSFWQKAFAHKRGHGCTKCKSTSRGLTLMKTTEKFINESNIIHNFKYDYSLVECNGQYIPVKIICPIHGIFLQTPLAHHQGHGCRPCNQKMASIERTKTTEEFIAEAITVHGNIFDYSKSIYNGAREIIEIICVKHGSFWPRAWSHLSGCGCPSCGYIISHSETEWLNSLNIQRRNIKLPGLGNLKVDGYDPITNTVYEYYGDFWHGNPEVFDPHDINPYTKTTYGQLYKNTMDRAKLIIDYGYNLVVIWEKDYELIKRKLE